MTTMIYRVPGIPDPFDDPAGYFTAVFGGGAEVGSARRIEANDREGRGDEMTTMYRGALFSGGRIIAAALPDEPATVQRARTSPSADVRFVEGTYERPVPQVVEGEYTYVEATPSKDVLRAAQVAHKIACLELGLSGISLGYFRLADGRAAERVVDTAAYPLMGFTYPASDSVWINVAQDSDSAAKATAHELKHKHVLDAFPGISKASRETAACRYVERFWAQHSGAFGWARVLGRQLGRE